MSVLFYLVTLVRNNSRSYRTVYIQQIIPEICAEMCVRAKCPFPLPDFSKNLNLRKKISETLQFQISLKTVDRRTSIHGEVITVIERFMYYDFVMF
jgi:hypothetical protein